ncbi:MAG TPA: helix-turn-helix domain-containing protein, partial [Solirubrobacteraceae bacterium]|nr:helix-turn-helix domain-containing protein [Solirubrobacteraceae bacterium]
AALADPTRRAMLQTALRDGETSVPALLGAFPISRQALAKHLAALDHAGLLERAPAGRRAVAYRPRPEALEAAAQWIAQAEARWDERLGRLKRGLEGA